MAITIERIINKGEKSFRVYDDLKFVFSAKISSPYTFDV